MQNSENAAGTLTTTEMSANNVSIVDYANWTITTAIYPSCGNRDLPEAMYLGLGLAGETGEVTDIIKKMYRDGPEKKHIDKLRGELGDVIWYWARLCDALYFNPSELLAENMAKLSSRKDRGVLGGSGDNR